MRPAGDLSAGQNVSEYGTRSLRMCTLPSRDMLEWWQPLTELKKPLPGVAFERGKPVQQIPDRKAV